MSVIIVLLAVDTIVQLLVCKLSLWWIIQLICRLLFCCRAVGATFKVRKLVTGEGIALAAMLLWNILFHKGAFPWLRFLLFIVFTAIAAILMYLDELLYVYVIEDADEDE